MCNSRKVQIPSQEPICYISSPDTLSVYICSFLSQSARREKVIFKKPSASIYASTILSKCGLSNMRKADANALTDLSETVWQRREKYVYLSYEIWKVEDRNCPLTSCTWQEEVLGPQSQIWRLIWMSGWICCSSLCTSQLGDYRNPRFLVEDITVNH